MKKFFAFLVVFAALFVSFGCSGGGNGGNRVNGEIPEYSAEELKNLEAEVVFWHAMGQEKTGFIQSMITSFNKLYPNIKVTVANQGGYDDLRDKVQKSIRSGLQPTLSQVYPDHVTLYMSGDAVRELDSYVNHPTYGLTQAQLNDYVPAYFAEGKIYDEKGTLYSLPFNKSTEVMFINASWFEEHGLLEKYNLGEIKLIDDETKVFVRNEGAHLTWEDIEEIGQYYINTDEYKQRTDLEKADYYAFSYDSEDNLFITLTQQWGGEYTKSTGANEGEFVFDNAKSREALQWYLNGHKNGYFVTASAWNVDYTSDKFTSGNVVMTIGSSAGCTYNDPKGKFVLGVLPYPQREAAYGTGVGEFVIQQGTNVALFNCEDADEELAGWLFLKFITSWHPDLPYEEQPTAIWCEKSGYFPILNSLMEHEKYQYFLDGKGQPTRTIQATVAIVGYEQSQNYFVSPTFPGTSKCRDEVENLVEAVLYAGKTMDEAYATALANLK